MRHQHRFQESGQILVVAILIGLTLFGIGAIALDGGISQANRRQLQSYADLASLAGSQQLQNGVPASLDQANYVALAYMAKALNQSSLGGCTATSCGGSAGKEIYQFSGTGYTVNIIDNGYTSLDVGVKQSQRSVLGGVFGFTSDVSVSSGRAQPTLPAFTAAPYAVAGLSGDVEVDGGGTANPTGDVGGPVYANGSYGANNAPHTNTVTNYVTGYNGTGSGISNCSSTPQQNYVNIGDGSDSFHYTWNTTPSGKESDNQTQQPSEVATFLSNPPTPPNVTYTSTAQAKDSSGNWKPGIYTNNIAPNGGLLNPGVYLIKGYTGTVAPGSNVTNPGLGQLDQSGAVAIVLDSTDNAAKLDLNGSNLNGIDDLYGASYSGGGTRDPQGTHNFVIWGGTWTPANGLKALKNPDGDTTKLTGIVFLPNQSFSESGNVTPQFAGSVYAGSVNLNGGGNGTQLFSYVCGLGAVNPSSSSGGLVR
jgi:Putative Flp pilus-assembly TadE/G-like